jgi:hypothetical protein
LQERWLVQQFKDKICVVDRHPAEYETICFDDVHGGQVFVTTGFVVARIEEGANVRSYVHLMN